MVHAIKEKLTKCVYCEKWEVNVLHQHYRKSFKEKMNTCFMKYKLLKLVNNADLLIMYKVYLCRVRQHEYICAFHQIRTERRMRGYQYPVGHRNYNHKKQTVLLPG